MQAIRKVAKAVEERFRALRRGEIKPVQAVFKRTGDHISVVVKSIKEE